MRKHPSIVTAGVIGVLIGGGPLPGSSAQAGGAAARLRWLVDLGSESLAAPRRPRTGEPRPITVSVPGAVYVFDLGADGSLAKRARLAADPAAPYGAASSGTGLAVADKQGTVAVWDLASPGDVSLRWRRDVGDRVTSVGWNGGDLVLAATWKGRLLALASADGRQLWSADVGGRAEAPGVVDGRNVFVATKAKTLVRLDAATGALRWKVDLPGLAVHPPVPFGEKPRLVLCGTWDGQLLAHDVLSGRVRWSAALPAKLGGAPMATSDLVSAVTADGTLHAYDPAGHLLWTAPGSAEGPATLLVQTPAGAAPRLVSVSKVLVGLDLTTGGRLADYPQGAVEDLRRRFADAMLEGVRTYSEAEKRALQEQEAFDVSGPAFGPARLVGPHVAFGTEDGWGYVFDADALRPIARYRAGQACAGPPRLVAGRAVAVAGEEVYALDPLSGKPAWKRVVGADPGAIVGDAALGLVAGGRVQSVAASDGALQWSLRGRFRSVAAPPAPADGATGPWIADDGEGNLRALRAPGRVVGAPLPARGDLLAVRAAPDRSWIAATREGRIFGVLWDEPVPEGAGTPPAEGRLVEAWETTFGDRLLEMDLADGRVILRSEGGSLVGLQPGSGQELWRVRLAKEDRVRVRGDAVLILGPGDLRVHDAGSGEMKHQQKVSAPAVGADLQGASLLWLDRWGGAHRVDLAAPGGPVETTDLGVPFAEAVPAAGGFLVTTPAGEVGFVDAAGNAAAPSGDGSRSRE